MKPAGVQTLRSTFVALPHLLNTQRNARRRDPEYTNTQESDASVIRTCSANAPTHNPFGPPAPVDIQLGAAGWLSGFLVAYAAAWPAEAHGVWSG